MSNRGIIIVVSIIFLIFVVVISLLFLRQTDEPFPMADTEDETIQELRQIDELRRGSDTSESLSEGEVKSQIQELRNLQQAQAETFSTPTLTDEEVARQLEEFERLRNAQ